MCSSVAISIKHTSVSHGPGAEEATQNRGGYSDCQDTFAWRKITFLWKDSKIWGGFSPLAPLSAAYDLTSHTHTALHYIHALLCLCIHQETRRRASLVS